MSAVGGPNIYLMTCSAREALEELTALNVSHEAMAVWFHTQEYLGLLFEHQIARGTGADTGKHTIAVIPTLELTRLLHFARLLKAANGFETEKTLKPEAALQRPIGK